MPPDDPSRAFLLNGIQHGFRITTQDYDGPYVWEQNYKSATDADRRNKVEQQIQAEIANGRYEITTTRPKIISALGALDKPNSSRIRLVHDCSRPKTGTSLNSLAEGWKFSYQSVQDAIALITPNCYLAKCDLSEAYRSVKIHCKDYPVTGLAWTFSGETKPTYLIDKRLPFGAKLSPGIFNEITQSVCRTLTKQHNISLIGYLDDFLLISKSKQECEQHLALLMKTLRYLGFAINYSKVSPVDQSVTFLGLLLDTKTMCVSLPEDKLSKFMEEVTLMHGSRSASKRELQSLAGKLNWCGQVIQGGRAHLRRLLDHINKLERPAHRTRITADMRADLSWWICFAKSFNGILPMIDYRDHTAVCIDACPIAAGAFFKGQCMYLPWEKWPGTQQLHINYKEVLTLEPAAATWCHQWCNKHVRVHCDNQAAVAIINKGTSKDPFVMAALRRLFWLSATFNFKVTAVYYPGYCNSIADACSRLHEPQGWLRLQNSLKNCYY